MSFAVGNVRSLSLQGGVAVRTLERDDVGELCGVSRLLIKWKGEVLREIIIL